MILEYASILSEEKTITHYFTTRKGGTSNGKYFSLNTGEFCGDEPENVSANREILCNFLGLQKERLIIPREVHGNEIRIINNGFFLKTEEEKKSFLSTCDALITDVQEVCLAVTTADCVPVLLYDKTRRVIAAVHAGWKGVVKEIVPLVIRKMTAEYSSKPGDILIATGPCISKDFYEVQRDVAREFQLAFNKKEISQIIQTRKNNTLCIDLRKAVYLQCIRENIPPENIEIHPGCTFQMSELYFSARRDSIHSGRMLAGIRLK